MAHVLRNDVESLLADFLREEAARANEWGERDCGLWLADWAQRWLQVADPAAHLRGRYENAGQAARLLGVRYPVAVGRLARSVGLRMTAEPRVGAIGLLIGEQGPTGAIKTAGGWATPMRHGFYRVGADFRVLAAWEPPCPRS